MTVDQNCLNEIASNVAERGVRSLRDAPSGHAADDRERRLGILAQWVGASQDINLDVIRAAARCRGVDLEVNEDQHAVDITWLQNVRARPGVASDAVLAVQAYAGIVGKPVVLDVHDGNPRLRCYYEDLGFRPTLIPFGQFGSEWENAMIWRPKGNDAELDTPENRRIKIDGVDRPACDASGRLVAAGEADDTLVFWRWFNVSSAVDNLGRPQPVFHGTRSVFDKFCAGSRGTIHFTQDRGIAERYAVDRPVDFDDDFDDGTYDLRHSGAPRVIEAYLCVKNPFDPENHAHQDIFGIRNLRGDWETLELYVDKIIAAGFDGILVNGMDDVAVFSPDNIRITKSCPISLDAEGLHVSRHSDYDQERPARNFLRP
jgi:hypothetical protein